jgi:hypothetical protein
VSELYFFWSSSSLEIITLSSSFFLNSSFISSGFITTGIYFKPLSMVEISFKSSKLFSSSFLIFISSGIFSSTFVFKSSFKSFGKSINQAIFLSLSVFTQIELFFNISFTSFVVAFGLKVFIIDTIQTIWGVAIEVQFKLL